ncbi:alpha/beta hydrolase [Shewanella sp. Actino-trap-3]|jgi:pimeloyl-ACP methyl ester carboxylesterase|nr:alpha/beta fold hydrolase [Shewanella sp. Actino-trap-3]PKG79196.1 alpha/beta hydrolase [Shewanella sp. Actino-trap-3]|tara:strand:+ start:124784 stop:125647 length:864 start_codon:yes stop_codon:yes gene_type:complete
MQGLLKKITTGAMIGTTILMTSACTMRLSESTFIASDEVPAAFTAEFTQQLQQAMPNHLITQLSLEASDHVKLNGFYIDNPNSLTTLVFYQGNGMKIEPHGLSVLSTLLTLNTDILVMDRRGLGASEGQPSINNIIADAQQQLDYLHQQYQPEKVILHGYSLGSFIAADLAKNNKIDALVLHGSATNADDWVDEKTPWYMAPFMTLEMSEDFRKTDNKQVVAQYYQGPLLVIAGEDDEEVPPELAEKLYAASQSAQKELIIVPDAGHVEMLDAPETMKRYQAFVRSL